MNIPEEIQKFINKGALLENYCLPHFYPTLNSFEDFQIGYKIHGRTGESITGNEKGHFKQEWYVICSGYADDPFFIDITEVDQGFPVYFAWHGTGKWTPIQVTENLTSFSDKLEVLKELEANSDNIQQDFEKLFDLNHEFWKEVYHSYEKEEEEEIGEVDEQSKLEVYQPSEREKIHNQIYKTRLALTALKTKKQQGIIGLKEYLLKKRDLITEMEALTSTLE